MPNVNLQKHVILESRWGFALSKTFYKPFCVSLYELKVKNKTQPFLHDISKVHKAWNFDISVKQWSIKTLTCWLLIWNSESLMLWQQGNVPRWRTQWIGSLKINHKTQTQALFSYKLIYMLMQSSHVTFSSVIFKLFITLLYSVCQGLDSHVTIHHLAICYITPPHHLHGCVHNHLLMANNISVPVWRPAVSSGSKIPGACWLPRIVQNRWSPPQPKMSLTWLKLAVHSRFIPMCPMVGYSC